MAAIEWGILPITDRVEIIDGVYTIVIEIADWHYRAMYAVARILNSFEWEESGQKSLSELPNRTQIEV